MKFTSLLFIALVFSSISHAQKIKSYPSKLSFKKTVTTLVKTIKDKGLNHFATIEHHKGAKKAGLALRPTSLIIFGNPKVGTKFMQEEQLSALDLPLKLLVYKNEKDKTLVSFVNMTEFKNRYGLNKTQKIISKVNKAIESIIQSVQK